MFQVSRFWAQGTKIELKNRNVLCVVKLIHTQTVQTKKRTQKCANYRGSHVGNYRGCPAYKYQDFRQHVVHKQVSYASILKEVSPTPPTTYLISPPKKRTWSFKSLSHDCVPGTCLKSKYRQNPICQNRSQKQRQNAHG